MFGLVEAADLQSARLAAVVALRYHVLRVGVDAHAVLETSHTKSTRVNSAASLSIDIASVSANGVELAPIPSVGLCVCVCLSVCLSVGVSVGRSSKTADWIRMPFGSRVGRKWVY